MQTILLTLGGLGWTLDVILFLLDLNYWLVSSLISFLLWALYFVFSLPGIFTAGLQRCWECVLLGLTILGESSCSLVLGALQVTGSIFRLFLTGLNCLQLVWNLLCSLVIQSKETIQRGLLSIALSGQSLQQQVLEVLIVACRLPVYLVNTFVNLSITVMLNICSATLSLCHSLLNVIVTSKELIMALFSQLSSIVVAVTILVSAPFQMTMDILVSCSTKIGILMSEYLCEIIILLFLILVSYLMFMHSPIVRFVFEKLNRVYCTILILLRLLLNYAVWRRVADQCFQLLRMFRASWDTDLNQRTTQDTSFRMAGAQNILAPTFATREQNLTNPITLQENAVSVSQSRASTSRENAVRGDPWKLLKQQEETRKCVICQDEPKTVLLLPCRHLCLCSRCAQILQQQPILQRNCPLCRQMILQALNVYM